jgi:hypothetical protein
MCDLSFGARFPSRDIGKWDIEPLPAFYLVDKRLRRSIVGREQCAHFWRVR